MQSPTNSNTYSVDRSPSSANHGNSPSNEKKESIMASISPVPVPSNNDDPKDDFDIILLHEDFPVLVATAAKVKETRQKIAAGGILPQQPFQFRPKTSLQPDAVLQSVERMQQTFLARPSTGTDKIPRGRFPMTDAVLEDSLLLLQKEYECGEQWLQETAANRGLAAATGAASIHTTQIPTSTAVTTAMINSNDKKKRGRGAKSSSSNNDNKSHKEAIAVKYSKWQTDILMEWMIAHKEEPFPDQDAIETLMQRTGLSQSQVVNWTTNVRKRNRKATCENGKKPHHFIDFLFLAHDREQKQKQQASQQQRYGTAFRPQQPQSQPQQAHHPPFVQHQQPMSAPSLANNAHNYQTPRTLQPLDDDNSNDMMVDTSDGQVLDTCISRDIFDEVDPLPIDCEPEETLLADFAQKWLGKSSKSSNNSHHNPIDTTMLDDKFLDFMDEDGTDVHGTSARQLLPSVTEDSGGGGGTHDQPTPLLHPSMDDFATTMDAEDLQQWVDDMGLAGTSV